MRGAITCLILLFFCFLIQNGFFCELAAAENAKLPETEESSSEQFGDRAFSEHDYNAAEIAYLKCLELNNKNRFVQVDDCMVPQAYLAAVNKSDAEKARLASLALQNKTAWVKVNLKIDNQKRTGWVQVKDLQTDSDRRSRELEKLANVHLAKHDNVKAFDYLKQSVPEASRKKQIS